MRLTDKQEAFCRKYVELGDALAAARAVGYGKWRVAAGRNMRSESVRQRIESLRRNQAANPAENMTGKAEEDVLQNMPEGANQADEVREVAEPEEILQFLTEVMRGTVSPQREEKPKVSERTKAAELLGRNQRLFSETKGLRQEQPRCVVHIWGEDELAD